jgi:hypothetical protein
MGNLLMLAALLPAEVHRLSSSSLVVRKALEALQIVASAAYLSTGVAPQAAAFSSSIRWSILEGPVEVAGMTNVSGRQGKVRRHQQPRRLSAPLPTPPSLPPRLQGSSVLGGMRPAASRQQLSGLLQPGVASPPALASSPAAPPLAPDEPPLAPRRAGVYEVERGTNSSAAAGTQDLASAIGERAATGGGLVAWH